MNAIAIAAGIIHLHRDDGAGAVGGAAGVCFCFCVGFGLGVGEADFFGGPGRVAVIVCRAGRPWPGRTCNLGSTHP